VTGALNVQPLEGAEKRRVFQNWLESLRSSFWVVESATLVGAADFSPM
jgi:hypothetical protein